MMKFLLSLVSALFLLASCQKCEECTLTTTATVDGATEQTEVRASNYCGTDLKNIKDNSQYEKDGIKYKWVCE